MHAKNYDLALSVFREFRKNAPPSFTEKENAEIDMFEVRILEESGKYREALDLLKSREKFPNILYKEEASAHYELLLGEYDAARDRFLNLIKTRNPENYDYHRGWQVRSFINFTQST